VSELMICLLLMAVGGIVWSLRDSSNPAALWTGGWLVLVGTALTIVYATSVPWGGTLNLLTSALLPAFTLAGALVYANRRFPSWLLPGALAIGVLRWGLVQGGGSPTGHVIGIVIEPGFELAAAWYALLVARRPDASASQRVLVLALVSLAVLDGLTALTISRNLPFPTGLTVGWNVIGPATFALQILSAAHRGRLMRLQLHEEGEQARRRLRAANQHVQ